MAKKNRSERTVRMVQMAALIAIVIVLQLLSYSVLKIGQVSISLVLIPIVAAGVAFGPAEGALLGFVFGAVTVVGCANGMDMGGNMLFVANPWLTTALCLCKATLCGWIPALIYHAIDRGRGSKPLILLPAALCPVINTGIFLTFTLIFFRDTLNAWAGGTDLLTYIIVGILGINFVVELLLNLLLAPAVVYTIMRMRRSNVIR